jgi:MobA/MobL family protein
VGRSAGRSAPAAAAYRHAECLTDERTGLVHDYTRKQGVETSLLLLPEGAPAWASERAQLWNAAERAETRKNSTVAREIVVALPAELSARERLELVQELGQGLVERHGVAVDIAIHAPHRQGDQRNHHAHLLLTTRKLEAEGLTAKTRELDNQRSGEVEHWRETWAKLANQALERAGSQERIDHRSLAEQGIDREPTQHQGPYATQLSRQVQPAPEIIGLERYDDNAMVRFQNDQRERVKLELATLNGQLVEEFRVETFEPAKPRPEEIRVETSPPRSEERPMKPLPPEVRQRVAERVKDTLWAMAGQQSDVMQAQVKVVEQRKAWAEATASRNRAETEVQAWRAQNPKRAWLHDRGMRHRDLANREQAYVAANQRSIEVEEAYKGSIPFAADLHAEIYRRLEVLHGARMREEQGWTERERLPSEAALSSHAAQRQQERDSERQAERTKHRSRQG